MFEGSKVLAQLKGRLTPERQRVWPVGFDDAPNWTPPLIDRVATMFGLSKMFESFSPGDFRGPKAEGPSEHDPKIAFRMLSRGVSLLTAVSSSVTRWKVVTGLGDGAREALQDRIVHHLPTKDRFGHDGLWHAMNEEELTADALRRLLDSGCSLDQKGVPVPHDLLTQSCLWGQKPWHTDEAVLDVLAETGIDFRVSDIPKHPFLDGKARAARIELGEAIHARSLLREACSQMIR